ncbi:hypothetical protein CALCODRAFT_188497 [Calocera cornea HHB12733]|uniref:Uncharacterized protein n=1 Tax=Calocera cornea HHB12733 TaxID=1353952 RepID=A0A165C9N7_9BASI|nr:hypothetical protein CALCODRAFT_188497 [Calocera cornea HHB12733]
MLSIRTCPAQAPCGAEFKPCSARSELLRLPSCHQGALLCSSATLLLISCAMAIVLGNLKLIQTGSLQRLIIGW